MCSSQTYTSVRDQNPFGSKALCVFYLETRHKSPIYGDNSPPGQAGDSPHDIAYGSRSSRESGLLGNFTVG
jgi:hypothetical protein